MESAFALGAVQQRVHTFQNGVVKAASNDMECLSYCLRVAIPTVDGLAVNCARTLTDMCMIFKFAVLENQNDPGV